MPHDQHLFFTDPEAGQVQDNKVRRANAFWLIDGTFSHRDRGSGALLKHLLKFILCVWLFCLQICLCIKCMPGTHRGRKRAQTGQDRFRFCYGFWPLKTFLS